MGEKDGKAGFAICTCGERTPSWREGVYSLLDRETPGEKGGVRWEREGNSKWNVIKLVTTVGNWTSVPLGTSRGSREHALQRHCTRTERELGYLFIH